MGLLALLGLRASQQPRKGLTLRYPFRRLRLRKSCASSHRQFRHPGGSVLSLLTWGCSLCSASVPLATHVATGKRSYKHKNLASTFKKRFDMAAFRSYRYRTSLAQKINLPPRTFDERARAPRVAENENMHPGRAEAPKFAEQSFEGNQRAFGVGRGVRAEGLWKLGEQLGGN
jgi:hypothetical protein